MTRSSQLTEDEQQFATVLQQTMQVAKTDPDGLLRRVMIDGRRQRSRRRVLTAAVAAVTIVVVGGVGAIAADSLARHGRLVEPASPATPATAVPTVWPPAIESVTSDSKIHSRVAALYLSELSGRTPTEYTGAVWRHSVQAGLNFDNHTSYLEGTAAAKPPTAEGLPVQQSFDLQVAVLSPASWDDPSNGPATIFSCNKRPGCVLTKGPGGTLTMTWTEYKHNLVRDGQAVNTVQYLRSDRSIVSVRGRSDMFTIQQLTAIGTSPLWDLSKTPSVAAQTGAEQLTPFHS